MTIVEFASVPPERWDAVVTASPDGWPFALASWRKVILSVEEWQLQDHSFALAADGQLIAVAPLQLDRRSKILGLTGWGGCGPVIAGNLSARERMQAQACVLAEIDRIASKTGAHALMLSIPPVTQSSIEGHAFEPSTFGALDDHSGLAQVIDLSEAEVALSRSLSELARRALRKADRAGVSIAQEPWLKFIDDYYEVHVETYHRTGVTPHPKSYFRGIASEMARDGHSVLWVARDRAGNIVGFRNDMQFAAGAWFHTGCSTTAALESGANYLLCWRAMLGAKAAGRRWYDCGEIFPQGGSAKQNGLTLFKTRFGGRPHRFVKARKDYTPAGRSRVGMTDAAAWLKSIVRRAGKSLLGA